MTKAVRIGNVTVGGDSPLVLIAATRKAGHTFAASSSLTVSPRRSFFSGTISETSAHFCYMILDGSVADKIHTRAPEVALHDFRASAPSATTREFKLEVQHRLTG